MPNQDKRSSYQTQLGALKSNASSFISHYRSLAEFISSRRSRFYNTGANQGGSHHWNSIINNRATWALQVATAGMFHGLVSPSTPWLALQTDDPEVNRFEPAKEWMFRLKDQMLRILRASNFYAAAPLMFKEQLLFATGCMSHVDDLETMARFYAHTAGSYYLAQSERLVIDTCYIETTRTARQMVALYSPNRKEVSKNLSGSIRSAYANGNYENSFPLVQAVEPNLNFVPGSLRSRERAFRSVHFEPGGGGSEEFLRVSGFDEFPFYCPRWERTNEDVLGTECPGMMVLGDVRQLQSQERRKGQGIDKMIAPPMHGPAVLANQRVSHLPAHGVFYDAPGASNVLKPMYEVKLPLGELSQDMARAERRIDDGFMVDLFLAITQMEGVQPRNMLELTQRHQERLLRLGPTLERQFDDFLDPMIGRMFNQMMRAGIVEPPPDILINRRLRPKYVSPLALAQQAVSTGNMDRLIGVAGALSEIGIPTAVDKLDGDEFMDRYAEAIGSPPALVRSNEVVQQIREDRAAQEQQQAQLAQLQQLAGAAAQGGQAINSLAQAGQELGG